MIQFLNLSIARNNGNLFSIEKFQILIDYMNVNHFSVVNKGRNSGMENCRIRMFI